MDKHNTRKISNIVAIVVSAFFAAIGVAGYQRTGDLTQLMVFVALAVLAFAVVKLLFGLVNKVLDHFSD
ncbi:hypothetical protein [Marinobacterium jannaschii]|uniref:hypothetical protein n=1 Tax=Marinobacterium jannaschii TaxID=64970 RepID=UPI000AC79A1D|nr:hypothetical protein [Marinobacterium jannaschii]